MGWGTIEVVIVGRRRVVRMRVVQVGIKVAVGPRRLRSGNKAATEGVVVSVVLQLHARFKVVLQHELCGIVVKTLVLKLNATLPENVSLGDKLVKLVIRQGLVHVGGKPVLQEKKGGT